MQRGLGMKVPILPLMLLLYWSIGPQHVIENPGKPTSQTAGRIVGLKEVLRIEEDGKDIIFNSPYGLRIGPDEGIYFYDSGQLYKYDSEGNFVCTFLKFGQGPGEVERWTVFTFLNDQVIVQAGAPPKILTYDLEGNFINEIKTDMPHAYTHFICPGKTLLGFQKDIDENIIPKKEGYYDMPLNLYEVRLDEDDQRKIHSFPIKYFVRPGMWWEQIAPAFAFQDADTLYIAHTEEYQIKHVDLAAKRTERIIKREYDRVKYLPSKEYLERIRRNPRSSPPVRKYVQDIRYLAVVDEDLWVLTSAKDTAGRPLIDIFDEAGGYIDNFYLDFPETSAPNRLGMGSIIIIKDYVFSVDQGLDDFYSIAKYQIIDD